MSPTSFGRPGWLGTKQWIQPTDGAAASTDVVSLASEINCWVGVSLAVAALITAAMAGAELVRLVRRLRSDLAPSKSS